MIPKRVIRRTQASSTQVPSRFTWAQEKTFAECGPPSMTIPSFERFTSLGRLFSIDQPWTTAKMTSMTPTKTRPNPRSARMVRPAGDVNARPDDHQSRHQRGRAAREAPQRADADLKRKANGATGDGSLHQESIANGRALVRGMRGARARRRAEGLRRPRAIS